MNKSLKQRLLDLPGFESLCRLLTRGHVRALMYHRFHAAGDSATPGVAHGILKAQLELILRNHDVWSPAEHLDSIDGRRRGRCPVVITIDDGYEDFHRVAFPLLKEANIPAMLFVTTGFVSGHRWFWWDQLEYIIDRAAPGHHELVSGTESFTVDLTTAPRRTRSWHRLADRCRFLPDEAKSRLITDLADLLEIEVPPTPPTGMAAVTWDQIREMDGAGILFGAHTVSHPILTRVSGSAAEQEIRESGAVLEEEIGKPVDMFAYPQGGPADFDPTIKAMVGDAYAGCYVAYQQLDDRRDPLIMPRYCVTQDMTAFRWALCGAEFIHLTLRKLLGNPPGLPPSYWAGSTEGEVNHG